MQNEDLLNIYVESLSDAQNFQRNLQVILDLVNLLKNRELFALSIKVIPDQGMNLSPHEILLHKGIVCQNIMVQGLFSMINVCQDIKSNQVKNIQTLTLKK